MYAIIEDSGTQIRVAEGDVVDVDLRDVGPEAKKIQFDRVLLVAEGEDGPAAIGSPYVSGAEVTAEIIGEVRGEKIDVIKYKRRKGYKVKQGHRQRFLRVRIDAIRGPELQSKPKPAVTTTTTTTEKKTTRKTATARKDG